MQMLIGTRLGFAATLAMLMLAKTQAGVCPRQL